MTKRDQRDQKLLEAIDLLADELDESPATLRSRERSMRIREIASDVRQLSGSLPNTWPRVVSFGILVAGFVAYLVLK